jgi:hypothetical protein
MAKKANAGLQMIKALNPKLQERFYYWFDDCSDEEIQELTAFTNAFRAQCASLLPHNPNRPTTMEGYPMVTHGEEKMLKEHWRAAMTEFLDNKGVPT